MSPLVEEALSPEGLWIPRFRFHISAETKLAYDGTSPFIQFSSPSVSPFSPPPRTFFWPLQSLLRPRPLFPFPLPLGSSSILQRDCIAATGVAWIFLPLSLFGPRYRPGPGSWSTKFTGDKSPKTGLRQLIFAPERPPRSGPSEKPKAENLRRSAHTYTHTLNRIKPPALPKFD